MVSLLHCAAELGICIDGEGICDGVVALASRGAGDPRSSAVGARVYLECENLVAGRACVGIAGWDVTAIDLPGHGSRPLGAPPTRELLADAVLATCPEPPTVLLGHSLGALVVLELLRRRPGWAEIVVLEDPPAAVFDDRANVLGLARSTQLDADNVRSDRASFTASLARSFPAGICKTWTSQRMA